MHEIKPCPFCGSDNVELVEFENGFEVVCHDCQCRTGIGETEEEVLDAWNSRAVETEAKQ